ncbi:MAG TPA: hypothetical protein VF147_06965, partial [Vicinamibacterales bacterium]
MSIHAGTCPVCGSTAHKYLFLRQDAPVVACATCGLARLESPGAQADATAAVATDRRLVERCLSALARRGAARRGLLVVTPDAATVSAGDFTVAETRTVASIERDGIPGAAFESAALLLQLEHAANPVSVLETIHASLAPGGHLVIATPLLGRGPAQYYFDLQTIQSVCLRSGFAELEWEARNGAPLVLTARRVTMPPRPVLSIVMPVFNERATFERTLDAVLAKQLQGIDK